MKTKMKILVLALMLGLFGCQKEPIDEPTPITNCLIIGNDTIPFIKLNYIHSNNVVLFQFFKDETELPTCSFCIYDTLINNTSYNTYLIHYFNKEEYEKYDVIFKLDSIIYNSSGICLYGDINNEDLKMNISMCN